MFFEVEAGFIGKPQALDKKASAFSTNNKHAQSW